MKIQRELIDDFKDGATHGKASNMFIEGDTLYSYGHHFPLAVRRDAQEGYDFLINGDSRSVSTSAHQNQCFKLGPQIPFSALNAARIDPHELKVIEATKDEWHSVPDPTPEDPNHHREEHTLGAIVLEHQDRFFLSGLDQNEPWHLGSYFLCELPNNALSVEDAYQSLKPRRVTAWEENPDKPGVLRQGEWFFLPTEYTTRQLPLPTNKNAALLDTDHYVTEMRENQDLYVRGTVKHIPAFRRPQHRRLSLGKVWHIAEKNLAPASWNAVGAVD